MILKTQKIDLRSSGDLHAIDITDRAEDFLTAAGLTEGTLTVFCPETSGTVVAMEFEPGLLEDMTHLFERLAATRDSYRHNQRCRALDGHAHMRALLAGASVTVPVQEGRLLLGEGQQLIFIDFGPGRGVRHVLLQAMGL